MSSSEESVLASVRQLAGLVRQAADAYDRPDLCGAVDQLIEDMARREVKVAVMGDFKRGKSSIVNGLVNGRVCSTDEVASTTVPTVIRYGTELKVEAVLGGGDDGERRLAASVDQLSALQAGRGPEELIRVDVAIDRRILETGLTLIDCPPAAGSNHAGRVVGEAMAAESHAVVFVTDVARELTVHELDLLATLCELCPTVMVAVNRIDLSPDWKAGLERHRRSLQRRSIPAAVIPVSASVREMALALSSRDLNEESGFTNLVEIFQNRVLGRADQILSARAHRTLVRMVAELEGRFRTERAALTDPARAEELVAQVDQARVRAEELKSSSSRWQRALVEGASDLQTEVEHQFNEEIRALADEATSLIDDLNPDRQWDTFEPWLRDELAARAETAFTSLRQGLDGVARKVAGEFADEEAGIDALLDTTSDPATFEFGSVDRGEKAKGNRAAILGDGLSAIRGSYSGLLMFGMIGGMFGFALLNPVTIALGVGLGGKAVYDERTRLMGQRRQRTSQAVARHIDRASVRIRKELRDEVKAAQRSVRETLSAHADRLVRSAVEAHTAARNTVQGDKEERVRRLADIDAELKRLGELKRRLGALERAVDPQVLR